MKNFKKHNSEIARSSLNLQESLDTRVNKRDKAPTFPKRPVCERLI